MSPQSARRPSSSFCSLPRYVRLNRPEMSVAIWSSTRMTWLSEKSSFFCFVNSVKLLMSVRIFTLPVTSPFVGSVTEWNISMPSETAFSSSDCL